MHGRPGEGLPYSLMEHSLDCPVLGAAGSAGRTAARPDSAGALVSVRSGLGHWGWDSVNTCINYVTARPQPKAKAPCKAPGQPPRTTMTPLDGRRPSDHLSPALASGLGLCCGRTWQGTPSLG